MLRSIFLAPISLAMLTQMSAGIFGKVSGKNFWPPKPGLTVITRMTSQSRAFGDVAGGQHQPHGPRLLELARELFEPARAHAAFAGQHLDRLGVAVVDKQFVPVLSRRTMLPPIRPSPPLRSASASLRLRQRALKSGAERLQSCLHVALEMDPQGPSSALRKHIEVAARLRGLDDAEVAPCPGIARSAASSAVI